MTEPEHRVDPAAEQVAEPGRSAARQILGAVVGIALTVVVLFVLLRVFIRPVPPDQESPTGHFGEPCAMCHIVTEDAEPVEVE